MTINILRGVNWSGWAYRILYGLSQQKLTDLKNQWNVQIIRFCITRQDYLNDSSYRQTVKDVTNWCKNLGITIILDQQWESQSVQQSPLPNLNETITLWTNISQDPTYKNDPLVWFDIWNEPHDVTMSQIKSFYNSVVTEIRKYANNICLVAGPDYASKVYAWRGNYLTQPNIVYACHMYAGTGTSSDLDNIIGVVLKDGKDVFIGETAPYWEEPFSNSQINWFKNILLPWLDGNNRGSGIPTTPLGFTAWSMTDSPHLTTPSGSLTPTSYGQIVKDKLNENPPPPIKYRCSGAPNFQCIEDPNGPYNSLAECQAVCVPPTIKYRCSGAPNFQCIEDPNGPFENLDACLAACKPPTVRYRCSGPPDFQCIEDPNGPFPSLAECQAACKAPQTKKFTVRIIGSPNQPSGILVLKSSTGNLTADEACKLVCDTIQKMNI